MKFKRGDVVLTSVPYAVVVNREVFKTVCSGCMKTSNQLLICSKCHHLRYCSRRCQIADWPHHRIECPVFLRCGQNFLPNNFTRLLVRCLVRHESDPAYSEEVMGVTRTVTDWVCHKKGINEKGVMLVFEERYADIANFGKNRWRRDDALRMFLKLWSNSVSHGLDTEIGLAVYLGQSALDHSCVLDKRYTVFHDGTTFVVKALKDADLTLKDIRTQNTSIITPLPPGRKEEPSWWFSVCACTKCNRKAWDGIKIPVPEIMDGIVEGALSCQVLQEDIDMLRKYVDSGNDELQDFIQFECAWDLAFNLLSEMSREKEALPYMRAILKHVKKIYGEHELYRYVLRKVEDKCRPSEEVMGMIQAERVELQQLESFLKL